MFNTIPWRQIMKNKEIKILKALVKAQNEMIFSYRIGRLITSEKVFKAIENAKKFYNVKSISDIT